MTDYDNKHLDGAGLDYLIDLLDTRYAANVNPEVETIEYLGSTQGSEVISLPNYFTELFCISSLNPWNNIAFNIPAAVLRDDSPIDASTGVEGGFFYKTGSYVGISASSIYADCGTYLISKTKAKLHEWFHNEDSIDGYNTTSIATTYWYYKMKRSVSGDDSSVDNYESISNNTIDDWWHS